MSSERFFRSLTTLGVVPLTLIGFCCYIVIWMSYATTFHPLSYVPGPLLARFSRGWMLWRVKAGDTDVVQRNLHARYGPVVRIAHDEICCSDPDMISKIYRTQAPLAKSDFYPPWNKKVLSKYPDHFSTTDEKQHAERRRIVNPVYSLSNVLQSEEYVDKCSELLVEGLTPYATNGNTLDLGEWLQWYAFDTIGELFFGQMFGFMAKSSDHESWITSLEALIPVLCMIATAPWYTRPFIGLFSFFKPSVRHGLQAMDKIIFAARDCVSKRVDNDGKVIEEAKRRDLLQQMLEIVYSKGDKVDFKVGEVQLEAWAALFAGSDTTAIATRAIIYYLLKTPNIYQELREEIRTATDNGTLSFPPRYSQTLQLPFLCATIKEAMRLHPSAGFALPRVSPPGGIMVVDKFIPAGFKVGMNAAVVGYDTGVFGADAASFNPRRWLTEDTRRMDRAILGFGAGTRTCLGKNISLLSIHKVVPTLIQNFEMRLEDPAATWQTDNKWLNRQYGLKVILSPYQRSPQWGD